MLNFFKKHSLAIQLTSIFLVVLIVSYAIITDHIELATGISIYSALIAITVLLISINEIRNKLRPWVAISKIDTVLTENPSVFYAHFTIYNTGPIPASNVKYIAKWYIKDNSTWKELEIPGESPFKSETLTLFPNQNIKHQSQMQKITNITQKKRD